MKILNLVQGSDPWKEARRLYVTASDTAALLKVPGAFKSRKKIMEEKLSGVSKPLTDFEVNLFARGHEVEEELHPIAEHVLGMSFTRGVTGLDEENGILASFDFFNAEFGVVVDAKNSTSAKKLDLAREFKVWEPYRVQVLTQMLVAKVNIGFLLMRNDLNGEDYLVPVNRDEETTQRIIKESALFLKEMNAPKPQGVAV